MRHNHYCTYCQIQYVHDAPCDSNFYRRCEGCVNDLEDETIPLEPDEDEDGDDGW